MNARSRLQVFVRFVVHWPQKG